METEIERKHRLFAIWTPWIAALFAVGFIWVCYAIIKFLGVDYLSDPKRDPSGKFYLIMGFGMMAIAFPLAWYFMRRGLYLLKSGVRVEGRIKGSGLFNSGLGYGAGIPMTFVYMVEGKEYSIRTDVPKVIADTLTEETRVLICADPKRPQRSMVLDYGSRS